MAHAIGANPVRMPRHVPTWDEPLEGMCSTVVEGVPPVNPIPVRHRAQVRELAGTWCTAVSRWARSRRAVGGTSVGQAPGAASARPNRRP